MLKKLTFLLVAATVVMFTGCVDEEAGPIIDFDGGLGLGTFPRLTELISGEFDLNDLSGSEYLMEVAFIDGVNGAETAQYDVFIAFDGATDERDTESMLLKTFLANDFVTDADGNQSIVLSIGFQEAATAMGVDINSIMPGERFQVRTQLTKNDGRVFSSANSTPAVTSAFGAIWNFNINATCPLEENTFLGSYTLTYDGVYDAIPNLFGATDCQALGAPPLNLGIELVPVAGSTTRRTFDVTFFPTCGWATDVTIGLDFVCTTIDAGGAKTSITCAAGEGFGSAQEAEATFDFDNDSTFSITYRDLGPGNDAGCGPTFADLTYTLVFTKN